MQNLESITIHEGHIVDSTFLSLDDIESMFDAIGFQQICNINESICPRFIVEFYSHFEIVRNIDKSISVKLWALNMLISISLEHFANILGVPCQGQCAYSEECSIDSLKNNQEVNGPYHTTIPSTKQIKNFIQTNPKSYYTDTSQNKVHKIELRADMQYWDEILRQNVLSLAEICNHIFASSCHMMYCILNKEPYNLAYFIVNQMSSVKNNPDSPMPYDMLLSHLFRHLTSIHSNLNLSKYPTYSHVMALMGHYDDYFDSD
ncbi:hypothetical protein Tco_0468272 [Tanacetum coccineum]